MTNRELREYIDNLTSDIDFLYKGVHGSVCPFSRQDISVSYGAEEHTFSSVEDAMNWKGFGGKCLNEITEELEIL